jgi:Tol biopolymer transport system component
MIRLSVSESGEEADGPTTALTMAHDGSKIAFVSTAGNLVPGDTNGVEDVFVYDHKQGALRRVSVDSHGNEALGRSVQPALSADGRFVAFVSLAENLVNADHNDVSDIFVRDLENGVTEIVSVGAGGVPANGTSKFPALSGDGRYVVYQSKAMNLAPTIATPFYQIYRYDRVTGEVLLVSQGVGGGAADGESQRPTVSADGRLVAFESWATNLTDTDTNGFSDVFVFDADRKQTEIISVSSSGEAATGVNGSAVISTDGNFVAFASYADNLADNDRNQHYDIYVRNRSRGETTLVSIAPGQVSGNGNSISPALADKARYVVFDSTATDLVSDDGNSAVDVFIFDRFAGIQLDHIQQLPLITR